MSDAELWQLERQFWKGDAEFFDHHLSPDALDGVPGSGRGDGSPAGRGLRARDGALAKVHITHKHELHPNDDTVVLVYFIDADRHDSAYYRAMQLHLRGHARRLAACRAPSDAGEIAGSRAEPARGWPSKGTTLVARGCVRPGVSFAAFSGAESRRRGERGLAVWAGEDPAGNAVNASLQAPQTTSCRSTVPAGSSPAHTASRHVVAASRSEASRRARPRRAALGACETDACEKGVLVRLTERVIAAALPGEHAFQLREGARAGWSCQRRAELFADLRRREDSAYRRRAVEPAAPPRRHAAGPPAARSRRCRLPAPTPPRMSSTSISSLGVMMSCTVMSEMTDAGNASQILHGLLARVCRLP